MLKQMLAVYGKSADADTVAVWWASMEDVTIQEFTQAASTHVKTSRFSPTPADIRDISGANNNGHLPPEEAWNRVPKSEHDGGWVTDEMMQALGACRDSIVRGDMVGARKAFLEHYAATIKHTQAKPKWWITEPIAMRWEDRAAFLEQARLTAPTSAKLPPPQEAMPGLQRTGNDCLRLVSGSGSTSLAMTCLEKLKERLQA